MELVIFITYIITDYDRDLNLQAEIKQSFLKFWSIISCITLFSVMTVGKID